MPNYDGEIRTAKNIYWWLWLSPCLLFFTGPFAFGVASSFRSMNRYAYSSWIDALAILALGLPHLWLLIPAIIAKSEFVRWHARQALLFQGLQSLILPIFTALFSSENR